MNGTSANVWNKGELGAAGNLVNRCLNEATAHASSPAAAMAA